VRLVLLALIALSSACASHVKLPPQDRQQLERNLTGQTQFLKLSYFVTPFFGDGSKRLLTPVPPEEVRMLNQPSGKPVLPGPTERVLTAGTRARIAKVEFPTSWAITERVIFTPRTQPWIYLEVEGAPTDVPLILVLRPELNTHDEFLSELERYLSKIDPEPKLSGWSEGVREAVRTKTAVIDMPAEALEMAWGYPERKKIAFEESVKKEIWTYADGMRVAHLADGRLTQVEGTAVK
jgi:hypothetical protein